MNPWITAQVVYLSVYLLAVYTGIGIAAGPDYEMNGTDSNARVYTTAESGVNIRTVVAYRKSTNERATSYLLSSSRPTFFVINENTGTISTTRKIHQKVGYQFSLTVIAKFGRKFMLNRPLLVDVVRKNTDRPTFATSSTTFLIYQRAKIGKVFGRLIATDQSSDDYNRNLTYSIQMYSHPKVFGIDDNGYLRVTDHIPSGVRVLNFTALVSDNGYPVETSWQIVSVNISTIPALSKFCTVKESHSWQICWKYVPPSSQRYVYDIQVRHNGYTHNNSVVAGTEFCYSNALLDTSGKYYYRVQTRLGLDKSPFTDWREAVDKGPNCEIFDPCSVLHPCDNGGSCLTKPTESSALEERYTCICPRGWGGTDCRTRDLCVHNTCKNQGTCIMVTPNRTRCVCPDGFSGDLCQFNKSFCQDYSPCNDRSECIDTENYGYRCECKPSFSGVNCTIKASCRENIQKDDTGRYVWPDTFYGRTATLPCNYAKREETASRPCIFNTTIKRAQWGRMDTSLCEKIGLGEASNAMRKLCSMTGDPKTLTAEQVANVTEKLEEIFSYSLKDENMASNMVQVISNMLAANTTVMARSNEMNKTSERLTQLLEDFTANVTIPADSSVNVKSSNVILFADKISPSTITPTKSLKLTTAFENGQKRKLKFTIPSNALTTTNQESSVPERVQLIAYNNAKLYIEQNETDVDNVDSQSVIFVKVKGRELRNLTDPVTYTIPNVESNKNHTCVYWDLKSRSWSTEGIVTKNIGTNQTVCESDHLTSFSLLLDPSPDNPLPEIHETVLTYISYIGCGISLFGIILTIITYALFGCLHGDPSGRILLNLCSSLLFLNVAFLMASQVTTLEDKYNHTMAETLCIIVTILIHYFLLTTLAWMCVEALNMYQLLVTVFNIYHSRFMLKRVLAAWGIPALTVGITLGADIRNYKTEIGFCFLSYGNKTAFYVALLTPACIILFVNTVVFGMVTKVILKPKFKNRHQCTQNVTSIQVRGCFTVMVLLGVTWLFGPLAINEMKLIFNYFFCILNSLQGFFIFVFRCLLNPEAKMAWIQLIKMGTLKKKKGPRKSVDSSSNGMYGGGGGGGGGNGHLGNRWSQKTMTVDIRDSTNLKKLSKPANDNNGIYDPNVSYKSYGSDWDQRNGSTRRSDKSKPLEFTRL